ncbi:unnamed protein product [Malus baccata var. baccata]
MLVLVSERLLIWKYGSLLIGPYLYVIYGSLLDTRSFPINFSFSSFACTTVPKSGEILVAGGGSPYTLFSAAGSRTSSVEKYDIGRNEWAGCAGFFVGDGEKREFWVIGGYGESRTISGVFPVDEHYRDTEAGERVRLGKIVVIEDDDACGGPVAFMLDRNVIVRYDMASNRWCKESRTPIQAPCNKRFFRFRFVVLDGELHVITLLKAVEPAEIRRSRLHTRAGTLYVQIYHPKKKTWRSIITKSPFHYSLDFNTAVMSTIYLCISILIACTCVDNCTD